MKGRSTPTLDQLKQTLTKFNGQPGSSYSRDATKLGPERMGVAATSLIVAQANLTVRIYVRQYFIMSERLIDATSILHCELEVPPV
jgi:hypothetical protein